MGCSVDTEDLTAEQARVVEDAVRSGALGRASAPRGVDVPLYEIEAETPSGILRLRFTEIGKSEAGRRVLEALRPHFRPVVNPRRR